MVSFGNLTHKNNITMDFIDYLEKVDENLIGGISYVRSTNLNILYKNNDKVTTFDSSLIFPLPESVSGKEDAVITDNFEIIYGRMSQNYNEAVLLVDAYNNLNLETLKALGYTEKDKISFDEILNKEFKIILNDDYYKRYIIHLFQILN